MEHPEMGWGKQASTSLPNDELGRAVVPVWNTVLFRNPQACGKQYTCLLPGLAFHPVQILPAPGRANAAFFIPAYAVCQ